jgi:hypothetical protein
MGIVEDGQSTSRVRAESEQTEYARGSPEARQLTPARLGLRLHSAIDHDILACSPSMASLDASTVQPPSISPTCHSWTAPDWQGVVYRVRYPTGINQTERETGCEQSLRAQARAAADLSVEFARDIVGMLPCHSFRMALYRTSPPTSPLQPNSRTPICYHIPSNRLFPPTASPATQAASHIRVIVQGSWL